MKKALDLRYGGSGAVTKATSKLTTWWCIQRAPRLTFVQPAWAQSYLGLPSTQPPRPAWRGRHTITGRQNTRGTAKNTRAQQCATSGPVRTSSEFAYPFKTERQLANK